MKTKVSNDLIENFFINDEELEKEIKELENIKSDKTIQNLASSPGSEVAKYLAGIITSVSILSPYLKTITVPLYF